MHSSTCLLVFHDIESLRHSQQLLRENFPNSAIQVLGSHEHFENYLLLTPASSSEGDHSCIVVTDQRSTAEFIGRSDTYLPVVYVEQDAAKLSLSDVSHHRPANLQAVDFSENEKVIAAITQAMCAADQFLKLSSRTAKLDTLADRERQIIQLASDGVPNKTIAVRLGISIKTVEKNRRNAYTKLSVSSTAEMASLVTFGRLFGAFV